MKQSHFERQITLIEEVDDISTDIFSQSILDSWGIPYFDDESSEIKWLRKIANFVRKSPEYATWSRQLKDELGLSVCSFTKEDSRGESGITVDLHHHPLTLVDICMIVMDHLLEVHNNDRTKISSFMIGEHVMKLHYDMKIGVVPLIKSLHEKYHNEPFPIPMEWVIGEWKTLLCPPYKPRKELIEKVTMLSQYSLDNVQFGKVLWPK